MTVYALRHPDGRWLYCLPTPSSFLHAPTTGVFADGLPMTPVHGDWWSTPTEATQFTATAQPQAKTVGYKLRDPNAESVRYPATLTLDEWRERLDRESDTLWELYTYVDEEQPPLEHVYDGLVMVLEGREPPAPDERQWKASLPHELGTRPEYQHLFPGTIPGLRDHLHKIIEAKPGVRYCFNGYRGRPGIQVTINAPYDKPQTRWQANVSHRTGKTLKGGRTVPVTVSRELDLPVPASVPGPNYAEALAEWDRQVEFWLGIVDSATVAACSHCKGTGHVNSGAKEY